MADDNVMVASAVVVPEIALETVSSTGATKRRQSSASQPAANSKRPRISTVPEAQQDQQASPGAVEHSISASPSARDRFLQNDASWRQSRDTIEQGKEEERKRGKRLFGALLGTLSQSSSSSTKQKRRADIDRKQQEKLKLQAEEYDEQQRQRLDKLTASREREQVVWNREALRLKHANMLATANFLKTETEPVLFFKPWELTPSDKDRIETQIEQAENQIARELEDQSKTNSIDQPPDPENPQLDGSAVAPGAERPEATRSVTAQTEPQAEGGSATTDQLTDTRDEITNTDESTEPAEDEAAKELADDNEEVVVEAGEDAVIW